MSIKPFIGAAIAMLILMFALTAMAADKPHEVKHVSATEAARLIAEDKGLIILDVRTQKEYDNAHIQGAVLIDYYQSDFESKLNALDKTKPYLVHCRTGRRSGRAVKIMQNIGFTDITHMDGGFNAWKKMPANHDLIVRSEANAN